MATFKLDDAADASTKASTAQPAPRALHTVQAALENLATIAVVAIVYFAAGKAGLYFSSFSPSSTAVWPATGIAFAALLLLGFQIWPAILVGAFFVNLTTAGTVFTSLAIAAGNTLEAVVAVYLTRRYANGRKVFEHPQDFFVFVASCMFAAAISATAGLLSLAFGGFAPRDNFASVWQTWFVGDMGGFLIVAPVIIMWIENPGLIEDRQRQIELWLAMAGIALIGFLVFGGVAPGLRNYPVGFLCIPILVWSAFRFGQREAATATFILAAAADWGLKHGAGPWAQFVDPLRSVIIPQIFIMTMAVMTIAMAAVVWERKRAEAEANQARNEAEEANRAKDRFLAMLGHELRNPIAALAGAADVLVRGAVQAPQSTHLLEIVVRQSGHLARLVDDLLDVERVTSGRVALHRRPLNLAECARHCVATLGTRKEYAARKIDLRIEDVWIDGDLDRVAQILTNLLSNALNHTRSERKIVLSIQAEGDRAAIRVQDDGEGISPDLLPHIFDLFVQGQKGTDRPRGGLGIGLTLVRRLVELHGGTIEAQSDGVGRGSAFTARFPRIEAIAQPAAAPRAKVRGRIRRRILLVEDNADVREAMREVLELGGHQVLVADSGSSGVASAIANRPDVALIDIGLPGLDGYEVARRIRSAAEARGMTLIALTGYGLPEDRLRAEQAGFDAHLVKPVNVDRLTDLLTTGTSTQ